MSPREVLSQRVSGNAPSALTASAAIYRPSDPVNTNTDRRQIAQPWQVEAYRHVNICGEARYAATLFSAMAGRAEIGISEPQTLASKPSWVNEGIEVEALAELAPTVRERTKLIRDYMLHRVIAGECYLVARNRVQTDPDPTNKMPIWEIVAVTELRRVASSSTNWQVRHENDYWIDLDEHDPVIRMWVPDPENRMEAWSPFRAMLPTLREIEWATKHIFTQIRSRLMSAGVWFLPDNLTFPAPPPEAVKGGAEAIAAMNEAERFMVSLAASSMQMLEADEIAFPTIVMSDALALQAVDQQKLIQFWSEIDDKAMTLRDNDIRRFALGMDLPPEQILGSSGIAVSGSSGSAGSVNHWGVWANEEQTISAHIEPALDDLVGTLTTAFLRVAVEGTQKVVAYSTASLRLRQDRSKESIELYDRGELSGAVMLRENGFDPETDMMSDKEFKRWLLKKMVGGSPSPEMMVEAVRLLGQVFDVDTSGGQDTAKGLPGSAEDRNLDDHPYEGPPRVDHEHKEAPFSARAASCEALVFRALEKSGNRLLNNRLRGRDKDRETPLHLAYLAVENKAAAWSKDFDFSLAPVLLGNHSSEALDATVRILGQFCADLYNNDEAYSREALLKAIGEA